MANTPIEQAAQLKAKGTEAFQKNDYDEAVKWYGEAIALNASDHLLYSNRSAAYAGAKKYEEALTDAYKCTELKPDFAKGYGRVALAQFHLNKLADAKTAYEEGLKYDASNQVLKTGLRECRNKFLAVLKEAADAQSHSQQTICDAVHKLIAEGCTSLSFLDAHQKISKMDLPIKDTLEKNGVSEDDCQKLVEGYDKAYDYEVMTAVQLMMFGNSKGDAERAAKLEMSTVIEVHQFMEKQMRSLVEEFSQLPVETRQSISKKQREFTAELMVSVAVESSYKCLSEDLELAVNMNGQQLQERAEFVAAQTELGALMQQMMETPFVEETSSQASSSATGKSQANILGVARRQACAFNGIAIAALGVLMVFGVMRWRASKK